MAQVRCWAGLDVHAAKVIAALVDGASGELRFQRLPGATSEVVAFCRALPGPVKVAYEAGPTGFGLARELAGAGDRVRGRGAGKDRAGATGSCEDRPPRR